MRASGLSWGRLDRPSEWHHSAAGAAIIRALAVQWAWSRETTDWFWPLLAGHHGRVPGIGKTDAGQRARDHCPGEPGAWASVQAYVAEALVRAVGFEHPRDVQPTGAPSRGDQLTLLGLVIMADWLASNQEVFFPVDDAGAIGMESARARAPEAWRSLDLRSGWRPPLPQDADLTLSRFGRPGRSIQTAADGLAREMPSPGLLIVEAPMGEGKTEAALAAAEVLAARFGARGLFIGMPTQATSDPMFHRVREWTRSTAHGVPITLLHGKRMFNPEWRALVEQLHVADVDEGSEPPLSPGAQGRTDEAAVAVEWFLGRKRGLLTPLAIGTVDHLLMAGTRTPHVMLRHAGLAGKVVILDEVHAATVYMAQFLIESLRWLASARTPIVLLTATLPPALKRDLVQAYLEGGYAADHVAEAFDRALQDAALLPDTGYPGLLGVCVQDGRVAWQTRTANAWRASQRIEIETIDVFDEDGHAIAEVLATELDAGGCVLVIRNTVDSAQRTYATLHRRFGQDVELLHARLTAAERARRTERELALLGPAGGGERPRRHILVATQVAEQSFDIDVDLLITDLAPIDLLLQRIGRLHRHDARHRPARHAQPHVLITGWQPVSAGPPLLPFGSTAIYRAHRLLRTAALVAEARSGGWDIPRDVPALVAAVYGDGELVPDGWRDAAREAADEEVRVREQLVALAATELLSGARGTQITTLAGLHERGRPSLDDDDLAAEGVVREGDPAAEVLLVRQDGRGDYLTLSGRSLTVGGVLTGSSEVLEEALGSIVRLPSRPEVTAAARALRAPASWRAFPLLGGQRPLVVDETGRASIGNLDVRYDDRLGLVRASTDARIASSWTEAEGGDGKL